MNDGHNEPIVVDTDETIDVVEDALQSVWQVANKLSRLRPKRRQNYSVTIFGSARMQPGHRLYEEVKHLSTWLAENGCDTVTGGGPGLMQAANEGSQIGDPEDKVRSVGVGLKLPHEEGANPFVEELYTHQTFYTRLHQFVRLSNAFIVVGGGIGTTLETMLIWQLLQVGHVEETPLILVGEMWRQLVDWARQHMLSESPPFASTEDLDLPICVSGVDDVKALLLPRIEAFNAELVTT